MLTQIKSRLKEVLKQEKGQGMVEYALLVGLIAIVVIVALVALGPTIAEKFVEITDALKNPPTP